MLEDIIFPSKQNFIFPSVQNGNLFKTKKAPQRVHYQKWCAILCDYRTNGHEEFKELIKKFELFEDNYKG